MESESMCLQGVTLGGDYRTVKLQERNSYENQFEERVMLKAQVYDGI